MRRSATVGDAMRRCVTLPFPPSTNVIWRIWRGRAVLSTEARSYKSRAALSALAQGMRPLEGPVRVRLVFYRPVRRGDLDNRLKSALDALRGIAYRDDSQVRRLEAEQLEDKQNPRVEVWVEAMAH